METIPDLINPLRKTCKTEENRTVILWLRHPLTTRPMRESFRLISDRNTYNESSTLENFIEL